MAGSTAEPSRRTQCSTDASELWKPTPRNFLEGIFRISGRSMSPVTIAPGVVRLVVAVLVPYCLPQGRVPRRLVPDQCDQRALPPPTRTSAHHR